MVSQVLKYLASNRFDFKFNFLSMSIGKIEHLSFLKIVDSFINCPYLTSIKLAGNNLNDCDVAKLCQCRLSFLKTLDLSLNRLTSESLRVFS
jgi:hypothetical protein